MPTQCTSSHGGTSAAAPLAAGILALALEVRPELTWRDVFNLVVNSAVPINTADKTWEETASGRMYSNRYGYGKFDAYKTVEMASTIPLLKPMAILDSPTVTVNRAIPQGNATGLVSTVAITDADLAAASFDSESLNMLDITLSLTHQRRGDVRIVLESPNGVKSVLVTERSYDTSTAGYKNWTMGTIKHWYVYSAFPFANNVFQERRPARHVDAANVGSRECWSQWNITAMAAALLRQYWTSDSCVFCCSNAHYGRGCSDECEARFHANRAC